MDKNAPWESKKNFLFMSLKLYNICPVIMTEPFTFNNNIEDNEVDSLELELRTAAADQSSSLVSS